MTTNYDSSAVGVPYTRVRDLRITYPAPNTAHVVCTEEQAVKMADGSVRSLGDKGYLEFDVAPADMATAATLVDPTTGQPLPGAPTTTFQQVMLGILAAVRSRQLARDQA
jgi:hypothetical protein